MRTGPRYLKLVNLCNPSTKANSKQELRQQVVIQHDNNNVMWVKITSVQQFAIVSVTMTQYVTGIKSQYCVLIVIINGLLCGKHIQFKSQDLVVKFVDLIIFYVTTV